MSDTCQPSSPGDSSEASAGGSAGCPDLRAIAGGRYRVTVDPAYRVEHCGRSRADDPWLLTVPCTFGHVFPWGRDRLAVSTNGRGETAQRLAALSFVRVEQDAADGFTLSFDTARFDELAAVVKPHRLAGRLALPADERKRAIERLSAFQFKGVSTQNRRPKSERIAAKPASDGLGHVRASARANSAA